MPPRFEVIGIEGIGEVRPGDDIAGLIVDAARAQGTPLESRDVLVIGQKIISKAEIVRMDRGIIVSETHHGWVCANAGVDQSNVDPDTVALLPEDSDRSARQVRERVRALAGADVAVIIADTFGRPWREGLTNIAIGVAGLAPIKSYLGDVDPSGRPLTATILAHADELAGAAELTMGKLDRIPASIVRGFAWAASEEGAKPLRREPGRDIFR
ncbi:MAG: coenzyme F420-0:L-glutamate ligase [Candidatus Rokubacteria bacterium]|nr:coenzyme F420-0:L-glutamate ligase [Candidatus Rokubacteria bacterium]